MVKKADVVVENFRPDVKRRLKIDYKDVKKVNPRIVYGSISGFGQDGPYENRPGFDQIAQGMGGLMSITGLPGQGPVRVGIPVADLTAGLFCALGILTALLEREKSKKGQHISTSLLQAQIFMLDFQAARWLIAKEVPKQAGNDHPTSIPTGVFKTTDGHINIATTGGAIWERFCRALGAEAMMKKPEYASAQGALGQSQGAQRGDRHLHRSTRPAPSGSTSSTRPACRAGRSTASTRCSPIRRSSISASRRASKKRDKSTMNVVGQPLTMSRTTSKIAAPPPELGQHTDEVLKEFGFKPKEIAALRKAKAL